MDEADIQVLIDGTLEYFQQLVDRSTAIGAPYLMTESDPVLSDFTGLIDIDGVRSGSIYFTAPSAMIRHILATHGETQASAEIMQDVVGEVANTISGNARKHFGRGFEISVPRIIAGRNAGELRLAERSFVVPVTWRQYEAALVVSLEG